MWQPGAVLLQLRAAWTHNGGTWSVPGGAIAAGEDPIAAALREAHEEAGIEPAQVRADHLIRLDHGDWSYTTVVAQSRDVTPLAANSESERVEWIAVDDVARLDLHPSFAEMWPRLAGLLTEPTVVVDAANVVGSRPDGWWKDRAGAAARLVADLHAEPWRGGPGLTFASDLVCPTYHVVLEGKARDGIPAGTEGEVTCHHAPAEGDDAIVTLARRLAEEGREPVVVTSDRGLRERMARFARCVGARALTDAPRTLGA